MKYLVTALLLAVFTASAWAAQPNIVLILADDLGWADSTPYGSTFHETPNIQRLADGGMRFINAHSTSPVCSPARASIMTGLYAERLGMIQPACHIPQVTLTPSLPKENMPWFKAIAPRGTTRLDTAFVTFAEVLRDNGYRTGHYGKWHLGAEPYSPLEHGFEVDVPHTKSHGPIGTYFGPKKYSDTFKLEKGEHLEDRMAQEAVAFIHENKDRPFFLNYWAFSVHTPPFAKPELLAKYRKKAEHLPADAKQRNPLYAGMVETFDANIGTLLDAIEEAGIADNTIVMLFSDNGGTLRSGYTSEAYWGNGTKEEILDIPLTSNHPFKLGKGTIHDGGTAVPFIVRWPGAVEPKSVSEAYLSGADLFPTFLEMAGVRMPSGLQVDGVSQVAAMRGEGEPRRVLYGYWPNYIKRLGTHPAAWIREGGYKLVCYFADGEGQRDRYELYHVKEDIGEERDLAAQMPERVARLSRKLQQHFVDAEVLIPVPNPIYDPAAVKPEQ